MQPYDLHFFPYPPLYLLAFLLLLGVLFALLRWGLIRYVYERLGLSRRTAVFVLFAALLGSGINIPLMQLPAHRVVEPAIVNYFGMQYVIPQVVERGSTVIAINVGGAVIPILLALRILLRQGVTRRLLLALGVVTVLMHALAHPVPGVGIALPPFLPSVATAVIAFVVGSPQRAPDRLRGRHPRDTARGGCVQPRQGAGPGGSGGVHRRGGHLRRGVHDRDCRRAAGRTPGACE